MKAVFIVGHGDLDQLEVGQQPPPQPKPGEVVISVQAAALNHLDIWIRKGRPGLGLRFPHILGSDAGGVVSALGDGVEAVKVGDEVVINPGLCPPPRRICPAGRAQRVP